ncbi:acyl-CoA dehydrogenase family protein [Alcanivorax quisquiliarum]|uniref:Acyl-CoA dehydrogenase family protein n=1 Tax=Alcanivorax quisquiliarum TaxID=2933565 RepID=A0ABT0E9Z0_9GAMM|nr:acyl-CoA dehydrogenase family protein [Alcanivorax quisquiliarum]MCK0538609.1 acyl-CoA dehydrogenase family protein [Alcanivorax quisquiliarum]
MNIEIPKKIRPIINNAHQVALSVFRPISRKYDRAEHEAPKELEMLASVLDGFNEGDPESSAGATRTGKGRISNDGTVKNGANMSTCLGAMELCYGDTGFLLAMPRQGLGNAAIAAVANDEQLKRFDGKWAAMAITEPGCGSDSAAIRTTARKDGDHYVLNGEKIFVTSGERADCVVVWATLDPAIGRAAIKSFVVEWGTPGMELGRLEKKLGIKASDTAAINFVDCRVPAENLLGNPEIDVKKGFGGVMETFDNTRPLVASMAIGVARASLERLRELLAEQIEYNYDKPVDNCSAVEAELYRMEAEWEAAYWLAIRAAWMADNKQSNSLEASISKAKAGRVGNAITLRCAELAGTLGYTEDELLEKWARDSKILDIFEGTQQIQQLIIARRLLGLSSSELK